jgi:hypothetical protein
VRRFQRHHSDSGGAGLIVQFRVQTAQTMRANLFATATAALLGVLAWREAAIAGQVASRGEATDVTR